MNTLAVYTSRKGFTTKALNILGNKLEGELTLVNLLETKQIPELNDFDRILIGGSVYKESMNKKLLKFCQNHLETLKNKKIGFFVSSLSDKERAKDYLFQFFPKELLGLTRCKTLLGGEIQIAKLSFWDRFILKMTRGIFNDISNIDLEEIERFSRCLEKQTQS